MEIDNTNNRVGINVNNPLVTLQVESDVAGAVGRFTNTLPNGYAAFSLFNDLGSIFAFGLGGSTAPPYQNLGYINTVTNIPFILGTNNIERARLLTNGNFGIGTSTPGEKLEVNGNTIITGTLQTAGQTFPSTDGSMGQILTTNGSGTLSWATPAGGSDNFGDHTATQNIQLGNFFLSGDGGAEGIFVDASGNVGIGTNTPSQKLAINGQVLCEEAKVVADIDAPDYVFKDDYNLRSLEEVEAYINENSHLPEIPSAAKFAEEGIHVGKMSFDLLKKVEELTLYMIDMKKENEALKLRISNLEKAK